MAFFLLGNFISTNEILYEYVDELTPFLVQALNDTISKIRSHAVSKWRESSRIPSQDFPLVDTLGFLARYRLSDRLIELKVPEKLLDVACHDTHVAVQEFALRVLKQMLKHDQAKEVIPSFCFDQYLFFFFFKILRECNATDKLSNLLSNLCTQVENNQGSEVDDLVDGCEELLSLLIEQCPWNGRSLSLFLRSSLLMNLFLKHFIPFHSVNKRDASSIHPQKRKNKQTLSVCPSSFFSSRTSRSVDDLFVFVLEELGQINGFILFDSLGLFRAHQ